MDYFTDKKKTCFKVYNARTPQKNKPFKKGGNRLFKPVKGPARVTSRNLLQFNLSQSSIFSVGSIIKYRINHQHRS